VRRHALAVIALSLAAVLAGCPIPQPLPDYPAGTITPPRILVDELVGDGKPIIFVPSGCTTTQPSYHLSARVVDTNTIETIDTRWFVNYDAGNSQDAMYELRDAVPPNADPTILTRDVPPRVSGVPQYFLFKPYDFGPAQGAPDVGHSAKPYPDTGILRVVELVVSNGFDPAQATSVLPNRAPAPGFETQVFRWVFLSVPESASVRCP
jgi:hypothetical protein